MLQPLCPHTDFSTLVHLIAIMQASPQTSARTCLQLLGHMSAMIFVIKCNACKAHAMPAKQAQDISSTQTQYKQNLTMPTKVKKILWTQPHNVCMIVPFLQTPPSMIVITDVSLLSWEAQPHKLRLLVPIRINITHKPTEAAGSPECMLKLPNRDQGQGHKGAYGHLFRQGGARSRSLCTEAMLLWNW